MKPRFSENILHWRHHCPLHLDELSAEVPELSWVEQRPLHTPQWTAQHYHSWEDLQVETKASLGQNSFCIREGDGPTHTNIETSKPTVRDVLPGALISHSAGFHGANRREAHGLGEETQQSNCPHDLILLPKKQQFSNLTCGHVCALTACYKGKAVRISWLDSNLIYSIKSTIDSTDFMGQGWV